ncbi:sulfatase [Alicyclobacillus fodiniaquatilis]|uniref:Sulfatase n=1 Tax=Alicyclobacillus fodiniaquatilis TaxID=1661150 RepID=A0ABW4JD76_9BACL
MSKPNVLWICTDQQRFDTIGGFNNQVVQTPNLVRLMKSGMTFNYCFSQSPVCTPSRASFLTGRYPRTTRTRQNGQSIPTDEVLVPRLFADSGYSCGLSGKLHLSACHPSVCEGPERRINDGYTVFHWSHHPNPDWETNAYIQWLSQNGVEFSPKRYQNSKYVQTSVPIEWHQTTWCANKAIEFFTNRRSEEWLFSVNFFDPHHPFDPPQELLEKYLARLGDMELPNYVPGELANKSIFQNIDHQGAYGSYQSFVYDEMSPDDHRMVRAAYYAMIELIDIQVGRMLDALSDTGQLENTIVVFMSDHGEMLGDHGIYWKGPYFYDPAVRVPLIMAGPGIERNKVSEALVELVDLAPSLLDAVGLPRHDGLQGQSLWPLLTGETASAGRTSVYSEYYDAMPWHRNPSPRATMVRTTTHKLVRYHDQNTELYDLKIDPTETTNRWDDPSCSEIKLALLQIMADRMAETVDPLPRRIAMW